MRRRQRTRRSASLNWECNSVRVCLGTGHEGLWLTFELRLGKTLLYRRDRQLKLQFHAPSQPRHATVRSSMASDERVEDFGRDAQMLRLLDPGGLAQVRVLFAARSRRAWGTPRRSLSCNASFTQRAFGFTTRGPGALRGSCRGLRGAGCSDDRHGASGVHLAAETNACP
jgi:hypothetical protein